MQKKRPGEWEPPTLVVPFVCTNTLEERAEDFEELLIGSAQLGQHQKTNGVDSLLQGSETRFEMSWILHRAYHVC